MYEIPPEVEQKIREMLAENQELTEMRKQLLAANKVLEDANMQLGKNIVNLKDGVKLKDQQLEELEEEISALRSMQQQSSDITAVVTELKDQVKRQREMIDVKTKEWSDVNLELESTKLSFDDLQKELAEVKQRLLNEPTAFERSDTDSEPSHAGELARLQEERDQLFYDLRNAQEKEVNFKESIRELNDCYLMAQDEIAELRKHKKSCDEQILELECQLSDLRTNVATAENGNSMFGEFADEYTKLSNEMQKMRKEWVLLKRENATLKQELEEARLVAQKREGLERVGRCVCPQLKSQLNSRQLEIDELQRTVNKLQTEMYHAGDKLKKSEPSVIYRSFLDSLKAQLDSTNKKITSLQIERDALAGKNVSLMQANKIASNSERIARENEGMLRQQIEMMRERHKKEISALENPDRQPSPKAPPLLPSVTEASKTSNTNPPEESQKFSAFVTPARRTKVPFEINNSMLAKTPGPTLDDPLKRLSLAQSLNMSESQNRTVLKRDRNKQTNRRNIANPLGSNIAPIVLNSRKDGRLEALEKETVAERPKLAPAKLFVKSEGAERLAALLQQPKPSPPKPNLNKTGDLFEFDIDKSPFDETEEFGSDRENEEMPLA